MKSFLLLLLLLPVHFFSYAQGTPNDIQKDSLVEEFKSLEDIPGKLMEGVTRLKKSLATKDSLLIIYNTKTANLDKTMQENKVATKELGALQNKSTEEKRLIKELKKVYGDFVKERNRLKKEMGIIDSDHRETRELIANTVSMIEEVNNRIAELKKLLAQ